ncbi:MAG: aldo/keto reductase [Planctomycetes bacterium]|nr:aldo/keto reductase [Planctomycetota bacterium]
METTTLGRTGIEVSRLCIGCWQAAGWASSDDERFVKTVQYAIDQGLNFLDTAEGYGRGHSEDLVGKAIAGRRDQVVVATKFSPGASRPEDVRKHLETSLQRLGTDYIDLFQQHWPPPDIPLADTIGEMEKLKEEGKIRAIGVSNWLDPEWEELDDPSRVDCLQPCHNLLWRSIEPKVLPLCIEHNIAVITYSSICQGVLAGRFKKLEDVPDDPRGSNLRLQPENFEDTLKVVNAVEEIAAKYDKTAAQTALRWLLDQKGITAPIIGASRPEQVDDNLGALGWKLDPEDWRRLSASALPSRRDLGRWTRCGAGTRRRRSDRHVEKHRRRSRWERLLPSHPYPLIVFMVFPDITRCNRQTPSSRANRWSERFQDSRRRNQQVDPGAALP